LQHQINNLKTQTKKIMDYSNVNLKSPYEASQNILDSINFDILLLEISCNLTVINKETIKKQFEISLDAKINEAKQVFNDNLNNILKEALAYQNMK